MKCYRYITETKIITQNGQIDSNCNTITFLNTGVNNVIVDGIRITPGTSYTVLGNTNEMNIKTYSILFTAPGIGSLTVIYKRYVN